MLVCDCIDNDSIAIRDTSQRKLQYMHTYETIYENQSITTIFYWYILNSYFPKKSNLTITYIDL